MLEPMTSRPVVHVAQQESILSGCSKRPDFSPAQPLAITSPSRPESAKADSSPWDASFRRQGRNKRKPEAYPLGYVEGLNHARTLLADL